MAGWKLSVIGLGPVMDRLHKMGASVRGLLRPTRMVGEEMADYAAKVTHRDTGTLASSQRADASETGQGAIAVVHPDPAAINPISGLSAAQYGPYEHRRGGSHAYYELTFNVYSRYAGSRFFAYLLESL